MKKLFIAICLLFVFNIIFKLFLANYVPNSMSLLEINILKSVNFFPTINDFSFRIFNVLIAGLINALVTYLIYKKTNNFGLSMSVGLVLIFSPWIVILTSYLNLYLIPMLIILVLVALLPNKNYSLLIMIFALVAFRLLFINPDISTIKISQIIPDMIRLFDLRILFFQGDPISPMLRIPITGFFFYLDLFVFFFGINYLFHINKSEKLKVMMAHVFMLGVISYLILPADKYADMLMTIRAELVFLWISVVVGFGYYNIISILKNKKFFFTLEFFSILVINLLFTGELYLKHFDKKNSTEWSYAEKSTIKYLMTKQGSPVYMTNQSDKLYRYWQFFKVGNMKASEITIDEMKINCVNPQVICIVKEEELSYFNIKKDDSEMQFGHFDGLPIYFILPKK